MKAKKGFTLVELLVVIGILGILMGSLFPAISSAQLTANLSSCAMRGRNLYVGITTANTEREQAGLPSAWPRSSEQKIDDTDDIAGNTYESSLDYFKKLFDFDNYGTSDWQPFVDADVSTLSGSGVPGITGKNIKADNITWIVASGFTEEMEDVLPVLVTRNVSSDDLMTSDYDGQTKTQVKLGKSKGGESDSPFSNKALVIVRKGGACKSFKAKYSKLNVIYNFQSFTLPTGIDFKYLKTGASK